MITLPLHDYPTRSASGFLVRYVMPRSVPPQLLGTLDRKLLFQIQAIGECIIGVGHGSSDTYAGHNDEVLMTIKSMPDVKGKVVVLLSCETAQQLGPSLIKAGAESFIGWKEDFVWVMDADQSRTPWKDEWASPAIMPVVKCINDILDGKTIREAFDNMLGAFSQAIEEEDEEIIASCLRYNRANAVLMGNRTKTVRPTPKIRVPFPPPPIFLPISS